MCSKLTLPEELHLQKSHWQEMHALVLKYLPEEACGILAGLIKDNRYVVKEVLPITNALHSRTRFRMDAPQQVEAFNYLEAHDLALVGIFHSHPDGPAYPSPTDIAEAFYDECVHLIWSPGKEGWQCHGFLIQAGGYKEIPVRIL